ncbi:MAG: endonuclease III [Spirochaetes bacterium]|nr:MAG: endonuclease III [Spirochaetota bacterium]RKX88720.1 MAG: endonuclease III [Spirochaetota bacterium]
MPRDWDRELAALEALVRSYPEPSVNEIKSINGTPWSVLVSTIISLRTKDAVTLKSSINLLSLAGTPQDLMNLGEKKVAGLIYPAGFYNTKAANLIQIAHILIESHQGQVPPDKETLMSLPGVGLKTANLVLGVGFGIPALCVDIHVHRIANRRGWISSDKPDLTEKLLSDILPEKWWIPINRLLVSYGQIICTPVSPHCSTCPVNEDCPKIGVKKFR